MNESLALAGKLHSEGEKVTGYLAGLTNAQRAADVYTEGSRWNVRNILAHLTSAEGAFLRLFEHVRSGGPGVAQDFHLDRYNANQQLKLREQSWDDLMTQFRARRAEMIAFVQGLSTTDLDRQGRHPFLGMTTLREMIKLVYIHNHTHVRDIRKAVGAE